MVSKALLVLLFSYFAILGCQTPGVVLRETPLGVSETRKAVVSVIGVPRLVSQNGRELYSKFYDRKGLFIDDLEKSKVRYHTKVTILGDQRPYDISVEVLQETKVEGAFEITDQDEGRAEEVAQKIKTALIESREKRNVIDDFRSF